MEDDSSLALQSTRNAASDVSSNSLFHLAVDPKTHHVLLSTNEEDVIASRNGTDVEVIHTSDWAVVVKHFGRYIQGQPTAQLPAVAALVNQAASAAAAATMAMIQKTAKPQQQKIAEGQTPSASNTGKRKVPPKDTSERKDQATSRDAGDKAKEFVSLPCLDAKALPNPNDCLKRPILVNADGETTETKSDWHLLRLQERFERTFADLLPAWKDFVRDHHQESPSARDAYELLMASSGVKHKTLKNWIAKLRLQVLWYQTLTALQQQEENEEAGQLEGGGLAALHYRIQKYTSNILYIKQHHVDKLQEADFPFEAPQTCKSLQQRKKEWQEDWDAQYTDLQTQIDKARQQQRVVLGPAAAQALSTKALVARMHLSTDLQKWMDRQKSAYRYYMQNQQQHDANASESEERKSRWTVSYANMFSHVHVAKLVALGLDLTAKKHATFDQRAMEWLQFRSTHKDAEPNRVEHPHLVRWVQAMRNHYRAFRRKQEGDENNNDNDGEPPRKKRKRKQSIRITQAQIDQLNAWGFSWDPPVTSEGDANQTTKPNTSTAASNNTSWDVRLEQYQEYCREHQTQWIPKKTSGPLGLWCAVQRKMYRRHQAGLTSSLTADKIAKLQAAGFLWERPADLGYARLSATNPSENGDRTNLVIRHQADNHNADSSDEDDDDYEGNETELDANGRLAASTLARRHAQEVGAPAHPPSRHSLLAGTGGIVDIYGRYTTTASISRPGGLQQQAPTGRASAPGYAYEPTYVSPATQPHDSTRGGSRQADFPQHLPPGYGYAATVPAYHHPVVYPPTAETEGQSQQEPTNGGASGETEKNRSTFAPWDRYKTAGFG